jgi:hypothetical protein
MRLISLFLCLMLTGCSAEQQVAQRERLAGPLQATPTAQRQLTVSEKAALSKALAQSLKDPASAQFDWDPLYYNPSSQTADYCGHIDAKNSSGAYTGSTVFRAVLQRNAKGEFTDGRMIFIIDPKRKADEFDFDLATIEFCQRVLGRSNKELAADFDAAWAAGSYQGKFSP